MLLNRNNDGEYMKLYQTESSKFFIFITNWLFHCVINHEYPHPPIYVYIILFIIHTYIYIYIYHFVILKHMA